MTGDMIYKALKSRGVDAELVYVADDFDPLRKVYPFLPDSYLIENSVTDYHHLAGGWTADAAEVRTNSSNC